MTHVNIELLKEAVHITDVLEDYDWLDDLSSNGEWAQTLCPFHNDTRPSATVNLAMDKFNCFACGVRGDIIDVVMQVEDLEFPEAVDYLVERFL